MRGSFRYQYKRIRCQTENDEEGTENDDKKNSRVLIEIGGYNRGSVENVETHVTACYIRPPGIP